MQRPMKILEIGKSHTKPSVRLCLSAIALRANLKDDFAYSPS